MCVGQNRMMCFGVCRGQPRWYSPGAKVAPCVMLRGIYRWPVKHGDAGILPLCSVSNNGSTFDRPRNYASKLSAMIHSARLICLEAALHRHRHSHVGWDARPRTGQLEELNGIRERFVSLGSQAPNPLNPRGATMVTRP
jgi:hypothetical protein